MAEPFDDEDPTPRAAPGKRPPTPAKPTPRTGKAAALPVAEAVDPNDHRLAWGHVGSVTKPGRLSDGTSRPGVIRVVEANIHYQAPPLDPYVWIPASLNFVGQYEMFWAEGKPDDARSLKDLGEVLRGAVSKPRLQALDNAADTLLVTAQRLHEHDARLGLLHPGNVLLVPNSEGRRIVLPDLGFTWRGSHGAFPWKDSPSRPRWLNEDPRENPYVRLWDEEPVWKQFCNSNDDNGEQELVPVESDLKTIARTFAAVLTGRAERDLHPPNSAHVWGVLRAVLKGDITSAEEFRARLAEHPLSEHWLAPRPVAPSQKSNAPAIVLGLLFLAALAAGIPAVLYFAGMFDKKPDDTAIASNTQRETNPRLTFAQPPIKTSAAQPPSGPKHPLKKVEVDWRTRPASTPTELAELLKQLENTKDPKEALRLLIKLYEFYAAADEPMRDKARPWVEYWRGRYDTVWESRYKQADEAVIKNPALRYESGQQIYELHREMAGLREQYEPISPSLDEREKECLLISELRSRELGSSR